MGSTPRDRQQRSQGDRCLVAQTRRGPCVPDVTGGEWTSIASEEIILLDYRPLQTVWNATEIA